jgi:hypothetical protein
MEHDDDDCLDSLRRERPHLLPLQGNHPDSNPEFADERKVLKEPEHLQQRFQNLFRTFCLALVIVWLAVVTPRLLVSMPVTPQNLVLIVGRTIML